MDTVIKILEAHGVQVINEGSEVFALEEYTMEGVLFGEWVNVTNYSMTNIKHFLGY